MMLSDTPRHSKHLLGRTEKKHPFFFAQSSKSGNEFSGPPLKWVTTVPKMFCARKNIFYQYFFMNLKTKVALTHKLQKTLLLVSNGQKLAKLSHFFVRGGGAIRYTQFILRNIKNTGCEFLVSNLPNFVVV